MEELIRISAHDCFVDPDIRKAESLPSTSFVDPRFLELEMNTIFERTWVLLSPQITADPSSRVPFSLLGRPLFRQRDPSNGLTCFPNVCTHAWHQLVEVPSMGGSIICPQHGREFGIDGRFRTHRGFENLEDFPRESDSLRKFPVESWGPFSAVCLGEPLAAFDKIVTVVKDSIPGIDPGAFKYQQVAYEVREVDGNWKQHAWNYMDNYHVRFVHKGPGGLSDAIDLASYRTELYKDIALQWAYARNPDRGFRPEQLASRFRDPKHPDRRVFALWWFIFPNLALNFYPWGLSVNQYVPIPGNPQRTEFHWYQYALEDGKFQHRERFWLNEQVDAEDLEAIGLVSRGARSGYAPRGRFAPREETGPHWFHRLVYTTMFEDYTKPMDGFGAAAGI